MHSDPTGRTVAVAGVLGNKNSTRLDCGNPLAMLSRCSATALDSKEACSEASAASITASGSTGRRSSRSPRATPDSLLPWSAIFEKVGMRSRGGWVSGACCDRKRTLFETTQKTSSNAKQMPLSARRTTCVHGVGQPNLRNVCSSRHVKLRVAVLYVLERACCAQLLKFWSKVML